MLFRSNAEDVNPIVMNGISTGTSNHDFFSQVGNGYLMGKVEAMQDSDYDIGRTGDHKTPDDNSLFSRVKKLK